MAAGKTKKIKLEKEAEISKWYHEIVEGPMLESPIELKLEDCSEVELPPLSWHNFNVVPKKMKLTNTGYTIILSGKWSHQRPYLTGGPLVGNYVFSQLHLHWGANDMEGSEHSTDGKRCPLEMHATFFRSCYLTQEAALKERDGVTVVAYFCQLDKKSNQIFKEISDSITDIKKPFTYRRIIPLPLQPLLPAFERDYLAYVGSMRAQKCVHYILWLICRKPIALTSSQLTDLRNLVSINNKPMRTNSRRPRPRKGGQIFHINPSSLREFVLLPL